MEFRRPQNLSGYQIGNFVDHAIPVSRLLLGGHDDIGRHAFRSHADESRTRLRIDTAPRLRRLRRG